MSYGIEQKLQSAEKLLSGMDLHITCQFCSKDFVSLGRHLRRYRERNHHDNGSNDARSSYQRSIVSVEQQICSHYEHLPTVKYNVLVVTR